MAGKKRKREDDDEGVREYYPKKVKYVGWQSNKKKYNKRNGTAVTYVKPKLAPDAIYVKIGYNETFLLGSTTGAKGVYQFCQNDCYDPNYTSTGKQPSGFAEWMAIYGRYTVMGSSCTIIGNSETTGTADDLVLIPGVDMTSPPGTSTDVVAGNAYAKRFTSNFRYTPAVIKHYISTAKLTGKNNEAIIAEDDYSGAPAASPARRTAWNIIYQPTDKASSSGCYVTVKLVYYVRFSKRTLQNT